MSFILRISVLMRNLIAAGGLAFLAGAGAPAACAQSPATLKAFATQPHTGKIEQALVGVETRMTSAAGHSLVRHGDGLVIRCDGFVLTSAALFSKPLETPKYAVMVTLNPGTQNERQVPASIVMHPGMVRRSLVGSPEPFVVLKIANVHTPALRLLLPDALSTDPAATGAAPTEPLTLAWSHWDEQAQHFQPVQKRFVPLAATTTTKRANASRSRLTFAHAEDIGLSGAVLVGPEDMGVGLISDATTAPVTTFSTFATLNTTTNCITPQSISDSRFAVLYPAVEGAGNGADPATSEPLTPPLKDARKEVKGDAPPTAHALPAQPSAAPDLSTPPKPKPAIGSMAPVPGGAVRLPAVLRLYQTDMTGAPFACVAPFLIDSYEVTNGQYAQFWHSLTPQEQKQNAEAYYPVGWAVQGRPFPDEIRELPVLGVRLAGAQAYATWAGKRLPTPYEWCLAAFGPGGGTEMPDWVKRYVADKQAAWQHVLRAHSAFTQQFPIVHQSGESLENFLPWLFWYPFEAPAVNFSYSTIMEVTTALWKKWIDPQHVLPVGSRPFDVSPYGAYDMILNADELVMPSQAYRNWVFIPENEPAKELYIQVDFPGPDSKERNAISGPYGPDAMVSYAGPTDIFVGYREPLLSRRLRGPANYPWQDAAYVDYMQAHARIKEASDMMYTAEAVLCLEPGPTIEAPDIFSVFIPLQPVRQEEASTMRMRYGKSLIPPTFPDMVVTDFHQSGWYSAWSHAAVPTHREMGAEPMLNSFVPYKPEMPSNRWAQYLVPGGFRCVR